MRQQQSLDVQNGDRDRHQQNKEDCTEACGESLVSGYASRDVPRAVNRNGPDRACNCSSGKYK
jgi:hypothetical protein